MEKKFFIGAILAGIISLILLIFMLSTAMQSTTRDIGLFGGTTMQKSLEGISESRNYADYAGVQEEAAGPDSKFPTMIFQNYGTNVFMETSFDAKSTFALDVDTASYTIAKNYIMNGELPPADAIRPEEFINYFNYDYPGPNDDFSINIDSSKSPFDSISYLRIGINARDDAERKDVILTFVIDVSGSMSEGNRLALVKKSVEFLIDQLEGQDKIGIVVYNTNARVLVEHTPVSEKKEIMDAVDSLYPSYSTNAEAGLNLGYSEANKVFDPNKINRVILISDGVANVGNTDAGSILGQLKSYKDKGITLTAVGVGMGNYNDALLEQIADNADGNYAYINDFEEAERIFSKQLIATLQVFAKDAKIQVDFNPASVKRYRLIGYENREMADAAFRMDTQDAGEVGAGHEVTAIYELEINDGSKNLGTVYLRYNEADTGEAKEISKAIPYSGKDFSTMPDSYKLSIAVARFAQILKMTQPPPDISKVYDILESIDAEKDLMDVVSNAKRMIEIRQGE